MESNQIVKPPTWFWISSAIALVWNLLGVGQYLSQAFLTDEAKSLMTADQLTLLEATPVWIIAAFAIAVWFGLIASIGLFMRKKWSKTLFLISLIAVIIQMGYSVFMTNAVEVYGNTSIIMPTVVTIIAVLLYYFSGYAIKRQWLN